VLQFMVMNRGRLPVSGFQTWLRGQMDARGWNAQLADASGLAPSTITNILTKPKKTIDLDTYIALSKGLEVPLATVLEAAGVAVGEPMSPEVRQQQIAMILQVAPWFRDLLDDLAALSEKDQNTVVSVVRSLAEQSRNA
jgi:transcriptional regulator with XRE-family HTH domain